MGARVAAMIGEAIEREAGPFDAQSALVTLFSVSCTSIESSPSLKQLDALY